MAPPPVSSLLRPDEVEPLTFDQLDGLIGHYDAQLTLEQRDRIDAKLKHTKVTAKAGTKPLTRSPERSSSPRDRTSIRCR